MRAALSREDTRHHASMLRQMGTAGVSSDESGTENGAPIFHVKVHRWRHPLLTVWMRAFDAIHLMSRFGPLAEDGRGAPPRERFDSNIVSTSTRRIPRGLPINAYNSHWLDRLPPYHREDLGAAAAYDFSHSPEVMQSVLLRNESSRPSSDISLFRIAFAYSGAHSTYRA